MTDQTTPPAPIENVGRGTLFALATIPLAIIVFAIISGFFGLVIGIAAIAVPPVAAVLYGKGAGAPLTRAGWGPFIGISVVSILLGISTSVIASAYYNYERVGGDGGIMAPAFRTSVRNLFTNGFDDVVIPIFFGLGLGAVAIASVLRGPRAGERRGSSVEAAAPSAVSPATPVAPTIPAAPVGPTANQPSPGIMLNGKPLDPKQE